MLDNIVKDNFQSVLESIELIRSRFLEINGVNNVPKVAPKKKELTRNPT